MKLLPANPDPDAEPLQPGQVRAVKNAAWVGTATAPLRLGMVQAQGKKAMPAADWARGLRLEPGESFA